MRRSRLSLACVLVGLTFVIAGFILPAVRFLPDAHTNTAWGPGSGSLTSSGWECAFVAVWAAGVTFVRLPKAEALPTVISGWINPLLLFYLISYIARKLNRVRPYIAGAIVICCVSMWIGLALQHVTLLIGHYLWIAGIVLILFAPFADQLASRNHREGNVAID